MRLPVRAISSVGRAPRSHRGGHGIEARIAHPAVHFAQVDAFKRLQQSITRGSRLADNLHDFQECWTGMFETDLAAFGDWWLPVGKRRRAESSCGGRCPVGRDRPRNSRTAATVRSWWRAAKNQGHGWAAPAERRAPFGDRRGRGVGHDSLRVAEGEPLGPPCAVTRLPHGTRPASLDAHPSVDARPSMGPWSLITHMQLAGRASRRTVRYRLAPVAEAVASSRRSRARRVGWSCACRPSK